MLKCALITSTHLLQHFQNIIFNSILHFFTSTISIFFSTNRVPLTAVLSAFAEAINTEDHLQYLKKLAANHTIDVSKTIEEIERNIHWMSMKVPEIATWVTNEKGAAIKLNFSIMAIIFSFSIIALQ